MRAPAFALRTGRHYMTVMRLVLALLALLPLAALASDRPEPGLMWNRTGLPLVFPLQVKTPPGADYIVTLTDADSGGLVLRGLAPPGTYRVHFDYGTVWHDDEARFADQKTVHLDDPLTFETRGIGRKAGHLVDLTEMDLDQDTAAAPKTRVQVFCQVSSTRVTPNCPLGDDTCEPRGKSGGYTSPYGINSRYDFTRESYTRLCD